MIGNIQKLPKYGFWKKDFWRGLDHVIKTSKQKDAHRKLSCPYGTPQNLDAGII